MGEHWRLTSLVVGLDCQHHGLIWWSVTSAIKNESRHDALSCWRSLLTGDSVGVSCCNTYSFPKWRKKTEGTAQPRFAWQRLSGGSVYCITMSSLTQLQQGCQCVGFTLQNFWVVSLPLYSCVGTIICEWSVTYCVTGVVINTVCCTSAVLSKQCHSVEIQYNELPMLFAFGCRSALQSVIGVRDVARRNNYYVDGLTHTWVSYYTARISSSLTAINEWHQTEDLDSHRPVELKSVLLCLQPFSMFFLLSDKQWQLLNA